MLYRAPQLRCRRSRKGTVVVLFAIALPMILVFLAICIDGGLLLERRRHAQATADAAALAAAERLFCTYPRYEGLDLDGSAAAAAKSIAELNGFSPGNINSTVTVRTAPQEYSSGPNQGRQLPDGYAEVCVEYRQKRFFSAIAGTGSMPVKARAVARGNWEAADVAIHVLDLHEPASLSATGESAVTVTGATVIVNSSADDGASTSGGTITAPAIHIVGGTVESGTKGGFVAEMQCGVQPQPDPLRHIPEPDEMQYPVQSDHPLHIAGGVRTVQPGVYRGGIFVSGKGNLNMEPGVYYMEGGGFTFSGQGNLNAQGVMIYNAPSLSSDTVSISGTGAILMSPPTGDTYKGLTLFQARKSLNTMAVSGGGTMDISGTFYTANGTLQVGGGGDSHIGSQYVSRFLEVVGNGSLLIDYSKDKAIPRRVLHLVE